MKRVMLFALGFLLALTWTISAQEEGRPEGYEFIVGPRVGASYIFTTSDEFTETVRELYTSGDYLPFYTLFGINFEQRILLGDTRSHFAFQELVLVGGLEQSIALPMGAVLIGYRDWSGFEIGLGPLVNLSGVGVVAAIGWTISSHGVYVPIDISVSLPNRDRPASVALTTGFNFKVERR